MSAPIVPIDLILSLPDRLAEAQPAFAATGGLHAAAIFDQEGALLAAAEDVGRHNATDKAIGALARSRWPLGDVILMVSGRISFEITQKAAVAGISLSTRIASSAAGEPVDGALGFGVGRVRRDRAPRSRFGGIQPVCGGHAVPFSRLSADSHRAM